MTDDEITKSGQVHCDDCGKTFLSHIYYKKHGCVNNDEQQRKL